MPDQLAPAVQGEFLLDVGLVGFHCLDAEVQFLGDFACAAAFANQAEDFQLTIRERGNTGLNRRRRAADVLLQHLVGHPIAQIHFTVEYAAHGNQYLFRCLLLHDVSVRASTQCALRVNGLIVHGQNQYGQVRIRCSNILEQVKPVRSVE